MEILFICLHGSAKSVIAAAYARRVASERGLRLQCSSAGIEPDELLPPHVMAGLASDGIDVTGDRPRLVGADDIERADLVISFGCDVGSFGRSRRLQMWNDLPAVSDGYGPARDAIIARVNALLDEIADGSPPPPSLAGLR